MSDILIEPTATQGEYRVVGQDSSLPIPLYYGTYDECRKYIQQNFITNNNRKSCELKLSVRGNILVDQSVEVNEYSNVKAIEQKTVATLETLGAFSDWLKENHEIEIPDDLIVEYLE